eukprot:m.2602 g.2602  ORF g.2602 m.2602 type:complete len:200 (+) comp8789_c1_seq1:211-810(+)
MASASFSEDMKERVYQALADVETPIGKVEVARRVGGTTGKDVNKYLYQLQKERKAQLVQEQPPLWKVGGGTPAEKPSVSISDEVITKETPIRDLPYGFQEAARLLIIGHAFPANWKTFADHLGYNIAEVAMFETDNDPPWAVIKSWQVKSEATLGKFIEIMVEMERDDVLTKLKERLKHRLSQETLDSWLGDSSADPGN